MAEGTRFGGHRPPSLATPPSLAGAAGLTTGEPGDERARIVNRTGEIVLGVSALTICVGVAVGQPVVALAGLGLGMSLVAALRFEALVLAALVIRASLDATKGGVGGLEPATVLGALFLTAVAVRVLLERAAGAPPRVVRAPFTAPLLALLGVSVLSGALSSNPGASLNESLRLSGAVAMVLALERLLPERGSSRRVLLAVFASAVIPMVMGLAQLLGGGGRVIGAFSRVTSTFLHPNPFSIYLSLLIVLAVALMPHVGKAARWALLIGSAFATALLFATYTRGSWIALAAGLLVVGLLQSRALVIGVIAASLAALLFIPGVSSRFSDLESTERYSGTAGNSLVWRVEYWQEAVSLSEDSPWLGIGLKGIERSTQSGKNAHNDVVRMYVELGVAGLICYLWLAFAFVRAATESLRATAKTAAGAAARGLRRGLAVGFAGAVVILGLVSVTSNVITQVVLLWYVAAIALLAVDAGRRAQAQHGGAETPGQPAIPPARAPS